jgi:uncharacterized protein
MSDEVIEVYGLEDEELEALPLFPLPSVVLLPGAAMGLHLFEPRYREMARDALGPDGNRSLAICSFAPGWESDYEGRPPLRRVAGAGRIVSHRENPDGTYDIVVVGVGRVSLEELPDDGRLYRRARATPIEEVVDDRAVESARQALYVLLRGLGVEVPDVLGGPDEEAPVLADRLAETIVTSTSEKQTLLELPDVAARLRFIADAAARQALGARAVSRTLN